MPSQRTLRRTYNAAELGLFPASATTGVWLQKLSSGLYSLNKAAAATTSVVNIAVPPSPRGGQPTLEIRTWEDKYDWNALIASIEVFYLVSTADLTTAPTVVLSKMTMPAAGGTGFVASTAITQTVTYAGVDAVGKANGVGAAGSHIAVVTITSPVAVGDNESLVLTITMGEAATSVLDIFGIGVNYL